MGGILHGRASSTFSGNAFCTLSTPYTSPRPALHLPHLPSARRPPILIFSHLSTHFAWPTHVSTPVPYICHTSQCRAKRLANMQAVEEELTREREATVVLQGQVRTGCGGVWRGVEGCGGCGGVWRGVEGWEAVEEGGGGRRSTRVSGAPRCCCRGRCGLPSYVRV
jgi:hypothetical protein